MESLKVYCQTSYNDPDVFLTKLRDTVQPICDQMDSHENEFNAQFNPESKKKSCTNSSITLVSMLVDGIKETKVLVTGALTASQIIMYNFKKKSRKAESSYR